MPSVNVKMEAFAPRRLLYQASDEAQSVGEAF